MRAVRPTDRSCGFRSRPTAGSRPVVPGMCPKHDFFDRRGPLWEAVRSRSAAPPIPPIPVPGQELARRAEACSSCAISGRSRATHVSGWSSFRTDNSTVVQNDEPAYGCDPRLSVHRSNTVTVEPRGSSVVHPSSMLRDSLVVPCFTSCVGVTLLARRKVTRWRSTPFDFSSRSTLLASTFGSDLGTGCRFKPNMFSARCRRLSRS